MALAGSIIGEINVSRANAADTSISNLDFTFTGEIDDILPAWRCMPAIYILGINVTKHDTFARLKLLNLHIDLVEIDWPSAPA